MRYRVSAKARAAFGAAPIPDDSAAPRMALHAAELGFIHPRMGELLQFESPLPIAAAAAALYAAASLYEAWHDPASPVASLLGGRS